MEGLDLSVRGKVALVTGASRGIGRDLALAFGGAGAVVVAAARRLADAQGVVAEVVERGGQGLAVELDVTRPSSARAAVAEVEAALGRIDVLVNNAGLGFNHDATEVTERDWDEIMDVNLKGLFFTTQAVAAGMLRRGYGRVVNVSSQAGLVGIERHAVYSASKGGVNLLTKVLALEWSARGVTVNAVAPTFIRTPGTAERLDDPDFAAETLANIPLGRFGTTADLAAVVLFLASESSALVTGAIIPVDGGWTAR